MDHRYITIGLAALISLAAWSVWGYETENVIFMVIDGLRDTEAFEDSTHQYIPHIWNDLRPQGTIYTKFYNTGFTQTTSACASFLSGRRDVFVLSESRRSEEPTIFEHYRHQLGVPENEVWVVCNAKKTIGGSPHSDHPAFGSPYGASAWFGSHASDTATAQQMLEVIDTYHPSLSMLWLKEVDWAGHSGDWQWYTGAIRYTDDVVYKLWEKIEADPIYAGRTTLILTTDHGRHDTLHGGFQNHGCLCHGCRHIMFLALGPDIKADTVIESVGDQIDVSPTIAELLGFDVPMAEGRILEEMIIAPPSAGPSAKRQKPHCAPSLQEGVVRLTETPAMSRDPSLVGIDGQFHLVWLERDTTSIPESWEVWYTTVDEPYNAYRVCPSGGKTTPVWADIAGDDSHGGIYVGVAYRKWAPDRIGAHPTYFHRIAGRGREGGDWMEWEHVTTMFLQVIATGISVDCDGGQCCLVNQAAPKCCLLSWRRGVGKPWKWEFLNSPGPGNSCESIDLSLSESIVHMGWTTNRSDLFSPIYLRYRGPKDFKLKMIEEISTNPMRRMSIDVDGQLVVACWAQRDEAVWEVYWRRSTDSGYTWMDQAEPLTSSGVGAWRPDVVVVGERVYVVWEDYRDGNGEIYAKVSYDGGETWSSDIRLTEEESYSIRPQVAVMGEVAYVVWQDLRDGNWEIYGKPIPISVEEGEWELR